MMRVLEMHRKAAIALILVIIMVLACNRPKPQGQPESVEELTAPIMAAYGNKRVHIGMPIEELSSEWLHDDRKSFKNKVWDGRYYRTESGIDLVHKDGRIESIIYWYSDDGRTEKPFKGGTAKGITAESRPEDVIRAYGQPDAISVWAMGRKKSVSPDKDLVDLFYKLEGIEFSFDKGRLKVFSVQLPDPNYEKELFHDDGPVESLRAIKVPESDEAK
jgi:hypothetical protein